MVTTYVVSITTICCHYMVVKLSSENFTAPLVIITSYEVNITTMLCHYIIVISSEFHYQNCVGGRRGHVASLSSCSNFKS